MSELTLRPVAHIRTDFPTKFGVPRQSGRAPSAEGTVVFEPQYRDESALRGIGGFSHLWLIFDFSEAHRDKWSPTVRPPRLGGNVRVGVFASRSPFRPNPIGLSAVRLVAVEKTAECGTVLRVAGADLVDGTPILDIKPYLPFTDSIPGAVGGFADAEVAHRLEVIFPDVLAALVPEGKRAALCECLADDPRPSYQDDDRVYTMPYAGREVDFTVRDGTLTVVAVR